MLELKEESQLLFVDILKNVAISGISFQGPENASYTTLNT